MANRRRGERRSEEIPINPKHTATGALLTFHIREAPESPQVNPTRARSGAPLSFHVRRARSSELATATGKPRRKGA